MLVASRRDFACNKQGMRLLHYQQGDNQVNEGECRQDRPGRRQPVLVIRVRTRGRPRAGGEPRPECGRLQWRGSLAALADELRNKYDEEC